MTNTYTTRFIPITYGFSFQEPLDPLPQHYLARARNRDHAATIITERIMFEIATLEPDEIPIELQDVDIHQLVYNDLYDYFDGDTDQPPLVLTL